MSHGPLLKAVREWGIVGTFQKLYKMRTLKFGTLMGEDRYGNKYYENTKDYPAGQHRWVEYAGNKTFYEVDASFVAPEWHGWLHHTTAEVPTSRTTGSTYKTEPQANATGSNAPYTRNLGGIITAPTPNLSQFRPRGFGLSNEVFPESRPHEELFYTQPGWPLEKRNASVRVSARKGRLNFSLRDTPLSIRARAAAKHGLSVEEFERYSDPFSPTRIALLTASGAEAASGGEAAAAQEVALALQQALPGVALPTDPSTLRVAMKLASGDGFRGAAEPGTMAAAVAAALSPAEAAVLVSGKEEVELSARIADLSSMVERYAHVHGKEAARGVEKAVVARDAALADLALLQSARAKVKAVEASFEPRVAAGVRAEEARLAQQAAAAEASAY